MLSGPFLIGWLVRVCMCVKLRSSVMFMQPAVLYVCELYSSVLLLMSLH